MKKNGPQILAHIVGTNNDEILSKDNYKYDLAIEAVQKYYFFKYYSYSFPLN